MVPCMIGTPGRYDIYLGSVLSRKTTGCSDWVIMRVTNQGAVNTSVTRYSPNSEVLTSSRCALSFVNQSPRVT